MHPHSLRKSIECDRIRSSLDHPTSFPIRCKPPFGSYWTMISATNSSIMICWVLATHWPVLPLAHSCPVLRSSSRNSLSLQRNDRNIYCKAFEWLCRTPFGLIASEGSKQTVLVSLYNRLVHSGYSQRTRPPEGQENPRQDENTKEPHFTRTCKQVRECVGIVSLLSCYFSAIEWPMTDNIVPRQSQSTKITVNWTGRRRNPLNHAKF